MEVLNGDRLACFEYPADPRTPPTLEPSADAGLPFITDSPKPLAGADAPPAARVDWAPFLMGCWPFLASMAITACFFFQGVSNGSPPGFVWCAVWRQGAVAAPAASWLLPGCACKLPAPCSGPQFLCSLSCAYPGQFGSSLSRSTCSLPSINGCSLSRRVCLPVLPAPSWPVQFWKVAHPRAPHPPPPIRSCGPSICRSRCLTQPCPTLALPRPVAGGALARLCSRRVLLHHSFVYQQAAAGLDHVRRHQALRGLSAIRR